MRMIAIVARYLMGLIFTVFGLNGFLNFIHQPPPANPLANQFSSLSANRISPRFSSRFNCSLDYFCFPATSCRWR
jgi:hypothetical protein